MSRAIAMVLVLCASLMAGCAGESGASREGGPVPTTGITRDTGVSGGASPSPTYIPPEGVETSRIEGIVIDDTELPIAGAQVSERRSGLMTTTDEAGRFTIEGVPVGDAEVSAAKAGYTAASSRTTVKADEAASITLILTAMDLDLPRTWTQTKTSFVDCAVFLVWRVECNTGPDRTVANWDFGDLTGAVGVWFETAWQPHYEFTKALSVTWSYTPAETERSQVTAKNGPSPLRSPVPAEMLKRTDKETLDCGPEGCQMKSDHGPPIFAVNTGLDHPDWYGVAYQQRVDDWVTVFYHGEFPQEYSALPSG